LIPHSQPFDFPDRWVVREEDRCIRLEVYHPGLCDIRVISRRLDIDCVESFGRSMVRDGSRTTREGGSQTVE